MSEEGKEKETRSYKLFNELKDLILKFGNKNGLRISECRWMLTVILVELTILQVDGDRKSARELMIETLDRWLDIPLAH